MRSFIFYSVLSFLVIPSFAQSTISSLGHIVNEYYEKGVLAYKSGDQLEARNNWYKYLELRKSEPNFIPDEKFRETQMKVSDISRFLTRRYVNSNPVERPGATNESPLTKPRRRAKSIDAAGAMSKVKRKPSMSSKDFVRRAERAEDRGLKEEALQYYQIAEKLDPSSAEIKTNVARLTDELK